jgi:two-component system CheB/CheR fusion protein
MRARKSRKRSLRSVPSGDGGPSKKGAKPPPKVGAGDTAAAGEPLVGPDGPTVVGIGASAGGLEAFSQVLEGLPEDSGLALVLVQHLAPQHESALPALLGGKTRLPVQQVTDGMRVEAGHVYVIPPNVQMEISDGVLHLAPRPGDRTQYTPVDFFLRSLAQSAGNRAIGVVLSGTASDGSIGVRELKAVGGITIAQDPETARYDGMPRAAIATGMVDLILAPQAIATELSKIVAHPYMRQTWPRRPGDDIAVDDEDLERVFAMLRASSGVDFRHYKMPTIKRRIQRRMALHRIPSFGQYIKYLREHPSEVGLLYQDILIHVTRFFREPDSFETLTKFVFPALFEKRTDEAVRAWVPGCSTGEEAYSLAIALAEYLEVKKKGGMTIQIFGTDISESAIEFARMGHYPESIAADVAPERLRRFFSKSDHSYRISKAIRDTCIFARQDVTRDPPFSRLDLILCRNVLIYMSQVLQRRLMGIFHYALRPSGFLMLGHAETIGPHAELFELGDKKHRVYRRKLVTPEVRAGFPAEYDTSRLPIAPETRPGEPRGATATMQHEVDRLLLERYSPAGVVVTPSLQIVYFRGQTGPYLEPAPGDASLNLMRMVREGLVFSLRKAIAEVRQRRAPVRKTGVRVKANGGWRNVDLEVVPITLSAKPHLLVLFEEPARRPTALRAVRSREDRRRRGAARAEDSTVQQLQEELAANREYLRSIIQELEAANEELQSANEEVLSSNEELQSTNEELDTAKEELQSTNEELNTVNEELHARNDELSRVNSDLVNLLSSVQIAIVIVNNDLQIRRFTPMAEKLLNLIPGDVGRPIGNIKPNVECPDLDKLCAEVIDDMAVIEREVRDAQGRSFSLRLRPYKNLENHIEGAVITLFDVEQVRRVGGNVEVP